MAILIYTSANSDPLNTRTDGEIDLSGADSLPASFDFYAQALDSNDPSAVFSYQWYITSKPTDSSAVLVNGNTDTVTVENIDVWGNHRLFCVAKNVGTGEFSESDILKAPNSSFVNLNVISPNAQIEKPAKGERNWYDKANVWAQRIEDLYFDRGTGGLGVDVGGNDPAVAGTEASITIFDGETYLVRGTDNEIEVSAIDTLSTNGKFATKIGLPINVAIQNNLTVEGVIHGKSELTLDGTANLKSEIFLGGAIRNDEAPYININNDGQTWYLNRDLDGSGTLDGNCEILTKCDPPTTTDRGAVFAGTSPSWPVYGDLDLNPDKKLPSSQKLVFNSHVEGTIQIALGSNNYNLSNYIEAYSNTDEGVWPHVVFRNQEATRIYPQKVTVLFHDITAYDPVADGLFALAFVSSKNIFNNSWTSLETSSTWTHQESANMAYYELTLDNPAYIDPGAFFGIIVGQVPTTNHPPVRMSVDVLAHSMIS